MERKIILGIESYLFSVCGFRLTVEEMLKFDLYELENDNEMTNLH